MAIGWPVLATYSLLHPRQGDLDVLDIQAGEVAILVGQASDGYVCEGVKPCLVTPPQRSYMVSPRVFSDPSVFVVEDLEGRSIASRERGAALLILLVWLVCAYATWRFILGPISRHLTMRWSGP